MNCTKNSSWHPLHPLYSFVPVVSFCTLMPMSCIPSAHVLHPSSSCLSPLTPLASLTHILHHHTLVPMSFAHVLYPLQPLTPLVPMSCTSHPSCPHLAPFALMSCALVLHLSYPLMPLVPMSCALVLHPYFVPLAPLTPFCAPCTHVWYPFVLFLHPSHPFVPLAPMSCILPCSHLAPLAPLSCALVLHLCLATLACIFCTPCTHVWYPLHFSCTPHTLCTPCTHVLHPLCSHLAPLVPLSCSPCSHGLHPLCPCMHPSHP